MRKVIIPTDKNFNYNECKKMYEHYKPVLNDESSFDEVLKNTFFYAFYDNEVLSLCVYFFSDNGKLWVNGYGIRKNHLFNKECFKLALSWFNCDIWAKSVQKPAIFGIMSCGFRRYKDDLFVFRNNSKN